MAQNPQHTLDISQIPLTQAPKDLRLSCGLQITCKYTYTHRYRHTDTQNHTQSTYIHTYIHIYIYRFKNTRTLHVHH